MFYGSNLSPLTDAPIVSRTWVKPKGASFVWFTLIGGGGGGAGNVGGGGGSGSVTKCLMPAFLVPDQLRVQSDVQSSIFITYQGPKASAGYTLLTAFNGENGSSTDGGIGANGADRTAFSAAGLYHSSDGQDSIFNANVPASAFTFLSAGGNGNGTIVTPNYGYPPTSASSTAGFFQMSPIPVGRGATTTAAGNGRPGGIGCGGGGSSGSGDAGGLGGQSMAVIISW